MIVPLMLMRWSRARLFCSCQSAFLTSSNLCANGCVSVFQLFTCYPSLVGSATVSRRVCGGVPPSPSNNPVLFICQEKDTSAAVLPSKGLHTSP